MTARGDNGAPDWIADLGGDDVLWAIFSGSRNPMLLADDDRRYVNANTAALVLLGYDLPTLRTLRIDDLTVPEARPFLDDAWHAFLDRGGLVGQFVYLRSDGSTVDVEFNATAHVVPGLHLSILINPLVSGGPMATASGSHAEEGNVDEPVAAVTARTGGLLDPRERRVMTLLAMGLSWHEAADEIGASPAEVRATMESAMAALGARTRAHAVSIAMRAGEIDPSGPPPA